MKDRLKAIKPAKTKAGRGRVKDALRASVKSSGGNSFEKAPAARRHHTVIGEREKHRLSTQQHRARSDQIRRETLLVEHTQQGRTNAFIDGRFGENDESMPLEDKLIQRFQRERQRQIKTSKFSLSDESQPYELTHGGRSLGEMTDNLDDGDFGDSDEEDERFGFGNADIVKATHFGGGMDASTEQDRRTKLEEAIVKSKLAKLERKEQKAGDEALLNQLDSDFMAMRGAIFRSAKDSASTSKPSRPAAAAYDDYEQLEKALQKEQRAMPSDRLKTDEVRATHATRATHAEHAARGTRSIRRAAR
tara:strand:- start:506 stop:1420 length:915 start_codon:yes stop_codon:yes gene_type:complete